MFNSDNNEEEQYNFAVKYDKMIPWETRLKREIPVIVKYLPKGIVLDVACSSGRHSFALNENGYTTIGFDISDGFIRIAHELAEEKKSPSKFFKMDASSSTLVPDLQKMDKSIPKYFDSALMLGNAIANLGNYENGDEMIRNVYKALKPGGIFFVQTVNRPKKPHYTPLREVEGNVVQRIMVPVSGEEHNVELHVNIIDRNKLEYVSQSNGSKFYMYTIDEFRDLVVSNGFEVKNLYGGYNNEEITNEDGETAVWVLEKPEIKIEPQTEQFFQAFWGSKYSKDKLIKNTMEIWQEAVGVHFYHCMRSYRFLYPRISSHLRYEEIKKSLPGKKILDIGCNLGTDLRLLKIEGAQEENLYGLDLNGEYFPLGKELYEDNDSKITFIQGDITGNEFYKINGSKVKIDLFSHKFDIIHAGSVLHLLTEEGVKELLIHVNKLLTPSGIFFGRAVGRENDDNSDFGHFRYIHTKESLTKVMRDTGFKNIDIQFSSRSAPVGERSGPKRPMFMFYCTK